MEANATSKYIRSTARKARLVADAVRGAGVGEALSLLDLGIKKKVAEDVAKVIKSAVANLQNNNSNVNVDVDDLKVKEIYVNEGPVMKRFRPRSQGRAYSILKRLCHITVTVSN